MKLGLMLALVLTCGLAVAGCGGGHEGSTTTTATSNATATGNTGTSKLQPGDVAVVGSTHITQAQLDRLMTEAKANYQSQGQVFPKTGTSAYESLRSQAIMLLVQQTEDAQEAGKLGVTVSDSEVEKQIESTKQECCSGNEKTYLSALKQHGMTDQQLRYNLRSELYEQKLTAKLTRGITVSESALRAYYAKHSSDFTTKPSRKVNYILVGKNKATLAARLEKELTGAGHRTWCTLAKKYSQDTSTAGKCGESSFAEGQTVSEFDKLLFSLPTNKVGKTNSQQYGWFVLEPTAAATPSVKTPFAKAEAKIRTTLLTDKRQAVVSAWAKKTQKTYCDEKLIRFGAGDQPTPGPCA
jgi:parvulin-like peptidyl-prolyl isomerase